MEPVDYLKILRTHWKVVAALVALAVVAVYWASPREAPRAYRAEHVLMVEAPSEEAAARSLGNVQRAALQMTSGEVPLRAAHILAGGIGDDGSEPPEVTEEILEDARRLSDKVEAAADPDVGTVTITATDSRPEQAVRIANAVGLAWTELVEEEEAQRQETAVTEAETEIEEIDLRLVRIYEVLQEVPPPPNAGSLRSEEDQLRDRRSRLTEQVREAEETVSYLSLTEATEAVAEATLLSTRPQRMMVAAVVAAILGFGVAVVLDRSNVRVRTKDQAEEAFGLPVLAEVPLLPLRHRNKAPVTAFEREPRVAEAYRSLRTALLLFRSQEANSRSEPGSPDSQLVLRQLVAVTSPEPGEGKSSTTANLAMAYAEAGHSVLILSWDLWRPLTPAVFGAADGPGISDYLAEGNASLMPYVQDTSIPGVRMVTAGVRTGYPAPRLDAARTLLDDARTLAGVVIVDTAPVLSASVSRELATLADAVVVTCRVGRTTFDAARRCSEIFQRIGAPALGVAMIGVATGAFADYYGPARNAGYDRVAGPRRKPMLVGAEAAPAGDRGHPGGGARAPSSGGAHRARVSTGRSSSGSRASKSRRRKS